MHSSALRSILWLHLQDTRLEDYRNYLNLKDEVDAHQEQLTQECLSVQKVSLSSGKCLNCSVPDETLEVLSIWCSGFALRGVPVRPLALLG